MNAETIKAVAGLVALVAVNVAAQLCGATLDIDMATTVSLAVITAVVTAWAAWKDHDITQFAQLVKEYGKAALDAADDVDYTAIIEAHGESGDGDEE